MIKSDSDPKYLRVMKSEYLKEKPQERGPYGSYLSMAKLTMDMHVEEARRIKKSMKRAINVLEHDCMESADEDEPLEPYIQKRLKRQKTDHEMKKQ